MRILLILIASAGLALAQFTTIPAGTSGGGGTGTVTHTGGALTADAVMVGADGADAAASNCTKSAGQPLTCPDGINAGTGGANPRVEIPGAISGLATIKAPDVAGTPTFTLPNTGSTGLMGSLTPVLAAQLPTVLSSPIPIPGAVFASAAVNNAASGDVDIYTAGAGRRALVGTVSCYNTAGTTTTVVAKIKISGTYYRLAANQAVSAGATATPSINAILEPGDSAALNFSQAGCNCWATVIDYPSTVPIYSPRLTSFSTGDNTIYTVPPSRTAIPLSNSTLAVASSTGTYATDTSHTIKWYVVNSGGSTGSTNQATASTAVSANAASFPNAFRAGSAGDFVVVNTDSATGVQFAWMTVLELP